MRILAAWLGRALSQVIRILPPWGQRAIGGLLGLLWFDVFRIRRSVILNNLERAFPEMSPGERVRLGRRSCLNMGLTVVEYAFLPRLTRQQVEREFVVEGAEHIERARRSPSGESRGVCLLTLHLGNGDLACGALSLLGYPMVLISKEFKLKWLNDLWFGMRARLGTEFIPPRNSSYAILKALKKSKFVTFVLDQFMGPPIGVETTFFSHPTGTALGLAVMAQRSRCPVVPVYTYRREDGKTVIRFESEIAFEEKDTAESSQAHMTQVYTDYLESVIRRHPEQWMWVHRRWKEFVR